MRKYDFGDSLNSHVSGRSVFLPEPALAPKQQPASLKSYLDRVLAAPLVGNAESIWYL